MILVGKETSSLIIIYGEKSWKRLLKILKVKEVGIWQTPVKTKLYVL